MEAAASCRGGEQRWALLQVEPQRVVGAAGMGQDVKQR